MSVLVRPAASAWRGSSVVVDRFSFPGVSSYALAFIWWTGDIQ